MKQSMKRRNLFAAVMLGLLLAIALPTTALGQGRGRDRDRGDRGRNNDDNYSWRNRSNRSSRHDKKCAKFRNCHDARDGRWDGRGPRANRVSNTMRNRNRRYNNVDWRNRVRNFRRNQ